jgi:glucokinase
MAEAQVAESTPIESLAGKGYVVGVDLGGTKILAAVFGPDGRDVGRAKKKSGARGREAGPVIDRIAECVREAAATAGVDVSNLAAIGIGAPGPVVHDTGVVAVAVNLGWKDVPLRDELERRLGRPVVVDNDVRLAVLAEYVAGAGRGTTSLIGVWPGTGIGGGVIVDGKIVSGASNSAGEIGHMTIKAGGPLCACGARGHLEALASRSAIVRWLAREVEGGEKTVLTELVGQDLSKTTSGDLAEALQQGDKLAGLAVERSAKYLSIGIASLANVLNPDVVVLGGGLVQALGAPFVEKISQRLEGRPLVAATGAVRIVQSALGDDAGIIGAAFVARRLAAGLPRGDGHAARSSVPIPVGE